VNILLFDTSVASTNLGDEIIMDSVRREVHGIFPKANLTSTPTHEIIGSHTYRLNKKASVSLVGGTNLLSSNMNSYNQWKINALDAFRLSKVILLGVGWWQYQEPPNLYTRLLLKKVLHSVLLHSVRDGYAQQRLANAGIKNVVNTGCPTMWQLSESHCSKIPSTIAKEVIFTLTDYNKNPEADKIMLQWLRQKYAKLHFWPQGMDDLDYLGELGASNVEILEPNLESLDRLLGSEMSLDYIGTRLHAGIRALQHGRRSIIVAIDNRATEIGRETLLRNIERKNIQYLGSLIDQELPTVIRLNENEIETWRNQFIN
jgi:polysaccharide pyruvyl transferase WcaK-like protein